MTAHLVALIIIDKNTNIVLKNVANLYPDYFKQITNDIEKYNGENCFISSDIISVYFSNGYRNLSAFEVAEKLAKKYSLLSSNLDIRLPEILVPMSMILKVNVQRGKNALEIESNLPNLKNFVVSNLLNYFEKLSYPQMILTNNHLEDYYV